MPLFQGFVQLGAGLSVGLAGLAAGFAIGIVGDAGVRGTAQQPRLFVGMVRSSSALAWRGVRHTHCPYLYRFLSSFLLKCLVFTVRTICRLSQHQDLSSLAVRTHCCANHERSCKRSRWYCELLSPFASSPLLTRNDYSVLSERTMRPDSSTAAKISQRLGSRILVNRSSLPAFDTFSFVTQYDRGVLYPL